MRIKVPQYFPVNGLNCLLHVCHVRETIASEPKPYSANLDGALSCSPIYTMSHRVDYDETNVFKGSTKFDHRVLVA
jgi:hypothetical protein